MRILDLFCCGGGAAMGLSKGFKTLDITGVDIEPQPKYPFKFVQADALEFDLSDYDFIWASPPCQRFTKARKLQGNEHPDLVDPIRQRLIAAKTLKRRFIGIEKKQSYFEIAKRRIENGESCYQMDLI